MFTDQLRPVVFRAMNNARANGYEPAATSEAEAEDLLDTDADVERLCEAEFGDDVDRKIETVAALVREHLRR